MIIPVREARPIIKIEGVDYYSRLEKYLASFTYSDNLDKADDLQLELYDPERRFIGDSFPLKGEAKLDCQVYCQSWLGLSFREITLDCGLFEIDDVSFSGPPNKVSIKANSIPHASTIKGENKSRAWEGKSLQEIVSDISAENQMVAPLWDTQKNPRFKRIDQNDQSDLEFLEAQIKDAGLMMKVKRRQIIIFSEREYEEKEPTLVLKYGSPLILGWSFSSKDADTASEAEVEFTNPETGKVTKARAVDKSPELRNKRKIRSYDNPKADPDLLADPRANPFRAGTLAEPPPLIDADYLDDIPDNNEGKGAGLQVKAADKAAGELREANKHRDTASFECWGLPYVASGITVRLEDWGQFDGKYFLEGVSHKIGPYRSTLNLHKELASKGY